MTRPEGSRRRDERGQGLIPTLGGFVVVILLLFLATQVVFDLYARSAVTTAAVDAARTVAGYRVSQSYQADPSGTALQQAVAVAESRARQALGAFGTATGFKWQFPTSPDGRTTEVRVTVSFDLRGTGHSLVNPVALPGLDRFERTVTVRVERLACAANARCNAVAGVTP